MPLTSTKSKIIDEVCVDGMEYQTTMIQKQTELGCGWLCKGYKLIKFNIKFEAIPEYDMAAFAPDGYNLTVDEVCTIINWFVNCSCQNMNAFFELTLEEVKTKIEQLQSYGY